MGIDLIALISLVVLPLGALIFLTLAFLFRGQFWWSLMSGLLWILFGISSVTTTPIFYYQRELGIAFIIIGIAIFWMPAWYKKKGQQLTLQEMAANADGEDIDDNDKLEREISRQRSERWRNSRNLNNRQPKQSARVDYGNWNDEDK